MADIRKRSGDSPKEKSRDLKDWVGAEKAQQISHLFDKVYPVFHFLAQIVDKAWPYLVLVMTKLNALWIALQPYSPLDLSGAAMGFFMAFFGGRYLLLFAAIEAARQTGYKGFADNIFILYTHFETVYRKHLADSALDEDRNGVADVDELSRKDLASRKFKLFLRVTDPEVVMGAASNLWIAFLGVIATLRLQFAQTLCLGVSIGRVIEKPLQKFVAPTITAGVNPQYRQWVPFGIQQFSSFVGCSIAFLVTRLIGSFYSAIKGGQLFAAGLLGYLVKHQHMSAAQGDQSGLLFSGIVGAVFVLGFWFQLATFFSLPFPLSFIMLPATIAENILMYFVASGVQTGSA